jgi:hypothetical protein
LPRIEGLVNSEAQLLSRLPNQRRTLNWQQRLESWFKRKRIGTIPLDDLPVDQREGYPSAGFSGPAVTALYWCDGHRTLAEVIRLTRLELGSSDFDFVGYFQFLEKHGYVEFLKGTE